MTPRLKPSQNQIQYLLTVGVPAAELGDLGRDVSPIPPVPMPAPLPAAPTPARGGFFGWLDRAFRFLLCTLTLTAALARNASAADPGSGADTAAQLDHSASSSATQTGVDESAQISLLWDALARLDGEVDEASKSLAELSSRSATQFGQAKHVTDQLRNRLVEDEERWQPISVMVLQQGESLTTFFESINNQLHDIRAGVLVEQSRSSGLEGLLERTRARLEDTAADVINKTGVHDQEIRDLRQLLLHNGQSNDETAGTLSLVVTSLDRVTGVLMSLFLVSCGVFLVRCGPMIRKPWRFKSTPKIWPIRVLDGAKKSEGSSAIVKQSPSAALEKVAPAMPVPKSADMVQPIESNRDRRSAKHFFGVLCRWASRRADLRYSLELRWGGANPGFASCCGNVRQRNEDFGCAFSIGSRGHKLHHVLIVADGVGGRPFGADASYLAARAAAASLIGELGTIESTTGDARQRAAENAMQAAMKSIGRAAERRGIVKPEDGLQTTLIVAVCPPGAGPIGYAYIGDGMGICANSGLDAEPRVFMIPQKADPLQTNLLAACLGPEVLGVPCSAQFERKEGELIILATDGVADRVSSRFSTELAPHIEWARGNLSAACDSVLRQMAEYQDQGSYVCDDNMTLAVSSAVSTCGQDKGGSNGKAHSRVLISTHV